jgi:hypothetical protein
MQLDLLAIERDAYAAACSAAYWGCVGSQSEEGNEALHEHLAEVAAAADEEPGLPYELDPHAKPDERAIRMFFNPPRPEDAPMTMGLQRVKV